MISSCWMSNMDQTRPPGSGADTQLPLCWRCVLHVHVCSLPLRRAEQPFLGIMTQPTLFHESALQQSAATRSAGGHGRARAYVRKVQ